MMNLQIYIQIILFSSPPFNETLIFIFSSLKTVKLLNYPQIVYLKLSLSTISNLVTVFY